MVRAWSLLYLRKFDAELSDHHREIINLRFFCGMSFSEISDTLEIGSEATARKALHRAVKKLREQVGS